MDDHEYGVMRTNTILSQMWYDTSLRMRVQKQNDV